MNSTDTEFRPPIVGLSEARLWLAIPAMGVVGFWFLPILMMGGTDFVLYALGIMAMWHLLEVFHRYKDKFILWNEVRKFRKELK